MLVKTCRGSRLDLCNRRERAVHSIGIKLRNRNDVVGVLRGVRLDLGAKREIMQIAAAHQASNISGSVLATRSDWVHVNLPADAGALQCLKNGLGRYQSAVRRRVGATLIHVA